MSTAEREIGSSVSSLHEAFERTAALVPKKRALVGFGGKGLTLTYAETAERVRRLGAGLQLSGSAHLTQVGILSENRPEWAVSYLGVVASGKTVVPLDANLKPNELAALIKHARLEAIFTSGRFEPLLRDINPKLKLYSFESGSSGYWVHQMADPAGLTPLSDSGTVAALIYTSGTTGRPKAVVLTHGNLLANLESIRRTELFDTDDIFLSVLPLHHTFEATCGFLTPLTCGCTVVYARSLKSRDIVEDMASNRPTVMCGVPLLFEKMFQGFRRKIDAAPLSKRVTFHALYGLSSLAHKAGFDTGRRLFESTLRKAGMDSLRLVVSGGAALPPSVGKFFNLLGLPLLQGYGLSEASPVVSVNRLDDNRFESVGPPLPGLEVRIDQPDASGVGEILVRGESVMTGYKDAPELSDEIITDGWLHTGDLGRLHDGHLYITGRAKNLIVSAAGKNIYPEELEEKLMELPYILEALVYAQRRTDKEREEVRALIVPDLEEFSLALGRPAGEQHRDHIEAALRKAVEQVNHEVADYKRIAGFDLSFGELEKTSTRKIKRFIYNRDRQTS